MKLIVILLLSCLAGPAWSQDSLVLKQIDAEVNKINQSNFKVTADTVEEKHPEMGLVMKKVITITQNGQETKKYSNYVHMVQHGHGLDREMTTLSTFYFNNNTLIKVEESGKEGTKKIKMDFYYQNEKPYYNTLRTAKGDERAAFLLQLSKSLLKTTDKSKPGANTQR